MAKVLDLNKVYKGWEYAYLYSKMYLTLSYMNLPIPKLIVDADYDNAHYYSTNNDIAIGLSLFKDGLFEEFIAKYLSIDFKNYKKKLCFVLFHELAHYLQHHKHKKWVAHYKLITDRIEYEREKVGQDTFIKGEYRKLKKETNADKIALILLDKFYIEGEN